jgi:hypothetical protein
MRRCWLLIIIFVAGGQFLRAEDADNLARIHVEAIGGELRLQSLRSMRVDGYVEIDGRHVSFTLLAQRPNRVRMETQADGHVLVQATDGVHPPWQMNPDEKPPRPRQLTGVEARDFSADAEFDDPLVQPESKGYALDYAGEMEWNDRHVYRILVTRRLVDSYYLLLDAETYFIVGKEAVRTLDYGRAVKLETCYEDFRPVSGVIMPHRIVVNADGKLLHETMLQRVEPNVPVPAGSFAMPAASGTR